MKRTAVALLLSGVIVCLTLVSVFAAPNPAQQPSSTRNQVTEPGTLTVKPRVVRTWTMAFVLATRPEVDTTTAAFAAKVSKVKAIRDRMPAAMHIATAGRGAITASTDVFVIKLDPPDGGMANNAGTDTFAHDAAKLVYEQTGDSWDFIAVYADYTSPHIGSRYIRAKNNTTKIGFGLWDGAADFVRAGRANRV